MEDKVLMSKKTYVAAHMIVSPSLESCTGVISVFTVDLDELVKDTACQVQILVSKVLA